MKVYRYTRPSFYISEYATLGFKTPSKRKYYYRNKNYSGLILKHASCTGVSCLFMLPFSLVNKSAYAQKLGNHQMHRYHATTLVCLT